LLSASVPPSDSSRIDKKWSSWAKLYYI